MQGRIDDNIETIRKRFKVFVEQSVPVVSFYEKQGKVHKVRHPLPTPCGESPCGLCVGAGLNDTLVRLY